MLYKEKIKQLTEQINIDLANFAAKRPHRSAPTQLTSEFLTNKEQGDWAETTLLNGINNNSKDYIAVRYGKNDDIDAGDDGFKDFYEAYQNELDTVGKRPDLLIFKKDDFKYNTTDISKWDNDILDQIVPKACCGIEVRSSTFLIDKYDSYMNKIVKDAIQNALDIKNNILSNYGNLLKKKDPALFTIVESLSPENMHVISFRCPSWKSSLELKELSDLLKELKNYILKISKRTFLSITPKVEDLKVVYTWIQKYNVPHYYVQVFFDKAYGISFEKILTMIGNPDQEGINYFVESDVKNQGKTTIKINASKEINILDKINLPEHYSEMKELNRGRLMFFVKFKDSLSVINHNEFKKLFGFEL